MFANEQIYLLDSNTLSLQKKGSVMSDFERTERLLKAFADKSRLQILDCIRKGISNPGEIARKLNRHRSTIEKHLRVLLKAKIVQKVPSLNEAGQLSIRYRIEKDAEVFLRTIFEATTHVD